MAPSSSSRLFLGVLAAVGLLAGCGRTQAVPVSLVDLKDRTLQFVLTDVDSLERTSAPGAYRFTVTFSDGSGCIQLAEAVTATFNGRPMKLEPGGVPDTGLGGREVCEPPRAYLDFDPEQWASTPTEDARIELQGGSHSVLLAVRGAKAKRHFSREGSTTGSLRRGQTHAYLWAPETDVLSSPAQASLIPKDGSAAATLTVQQDGLRSRFLLPAATVQGEYVLRLSATAEGEVLACEGVAACEGALYHSEEFNVLVVP
jgi:hypothetical protein